MSPVCPGLSSANILPANSKRERRRRRDVDIFDFRDSDLAAYDSTDFDASIGYFNIDGESIGVKMLEEASSSVFDVDSGASGWNISRKKHKFHAISCAKDDENLHVASLLLPPYFSYPPPFAKIPETLYYYHEAGNCSISNNAGTCNPRFANISSSKRSFEIHVESYKDKNTCERSVRKIPATQNKLSCDVNPEWKQFKCLPVKKRICKQNHIYRSSSLQKKICAGTSLKLSSINFARNLDPEGDSRNLLPSRNGSETEMKEDSLVRENLSSSQICLDGESTVVLTSGQLDRKQGVNMSEVEGTSRQTRMETEDSTTMVENEKIDELKTTCTFSELEMRVTPLGRDNCKKILPSDSAPKTQSLLTTPDAQSQCTGLYEVNEESDEFAHICSESVQHKISAGATVSARNGCFVASRVSDECQDETKVSDVCDHLCGANGDMDKSRIQRQFDAVIQREMQKIKMCALAKSHMKMNLRGRAKLELLFNDDKPQIMRALIYVVHVFSLDERLLSCRNDRRIALLEMDNKCLRICEAFVVRFGSKDGQARWNLLFALDESLTSL